jgi:deoxyribodipyrimidine photolyase-like uncharacterized protein
MLASSLNLKLLNPLEVIKKAEQAYHAQALAFGQCGRLYPADFRLA